MEIAVNGSLYKARTMGRNLEISRLMKPMFAIGMNRAIPAGLAMSVDEGRPEANG